MFKMLICLVTFVLLLALTTQGYAELIYVLPDFRVAPPPMEGTNNRTQINFNFSRLPEFADLVDPASGMIGGGNIAGDLYFALRAYPLTTIAGPAFHGFAWISPVRGDIAFATTEEEALYAAVSDPRMAGEPNPEDKGTNVPRGGVDLSWEPGEYATQHDIYFGDNFDDVNDATTDSVAYLVRQVKTTLALGRESLSGFKSYNTTTSSHCKQYSVRNQRVLLQTTRMKLRKYV